MNDVTSLLAEVRRCGGLVYRIGDRIRIGRQSAVPADLLERLRSHKEELLETLPNGHVEGDWLGLRVHSRLLDADVWLAPDDADARQLEAELVAEGETAPIIFTVDEVMALAGMLETDRQSLLRTLVTIKGALPGAVLDHVTPQSGGVHD